MRQITQNKEFYFLGGRGIGPKIEKNSVEGAILWYLLFNRDRLVNVNEMDLFASGEDIERLRRRLNRNAPTIERAVRDGETYYRYPPRIKPHPRGVGGFSSGYEPLPMRLHSTIVDI